MTEHQIKVERTARYYTLGELNENTKTIWFVVHGYGQLSQYFIKKFASIVDNQTFIVAPEAPSRFYLGEDFKRVGASWMTRELRQSEIDDNNDYLNALYDSLLKDHDLNNISINILGFSQGCATVCRWLDTGQIKCNRLLLWAGFFSNGIREVIEPEKLKDVETYYIYGDKDEFLVAYPEITEKFMATMIQDFNPKVIRFDGKHTVDEPTLKSIIAGF
ncbi:esterase [Emticicia aquatilis]|uniref:Esterase n=1 Tax=Emticicia aquatilis TaxID=1537369 RepID=A0A916Z0B9_9BACT|nr:phospholipase [Emticicia aquatilis]GGD69612.1 esterase [Emticicia aquatilis]